MSTDDILWSPLFDVLDEYTRDEDAKALFEVSREKYLAERAAQTFGTANPSLMEKPFWKYMIAFGGATSNFRETFDPPESAWDYWKPVWCFNREGQTETKLRDGRVICIGGRHVVFDDPDSCIYNDVVVILPPNQPSQILTPQRIRIYGYPKDEFPPTDNHTATCVRDVKTG
ncbi:MAG: hypothetical protein L6R38_001971 [Xanthoria sp. 2 TBL-2021]|nr:MAG: hypothetical protein L6R38_001971 [Xanthoria sp. 2 TBL-2021]